MVVVHDADSPAGAQETRQCADDPGPIWQPLRLAVLYLGEDAANDPQTLRFYLERAFPDAPSRDATSAHPES